MYSIKKNYSNFEAECTFCHELLRIMQPVHGTTPSKIYIYDAPNIDPKTVYIQTSGILNRIWQSWSHFWRNYWLTHFFGGFSYGGSIAINTLGIPGITTSRVTEGQAIYIIMQAAGFNMTRYRTGCVQYFQEPTWGDINFIEKLSLRFITPGTRILSALSVFGDSADHLQQVRNASIHISRESQLLLKSNLLPRYTITNFKYPTDIAYARPIGSTKVGILHWIDELNAFLQLL